MSFRRLVQCFALLLTMGCEGEHAPAVEAPTEPLGQAEAAEVHAPETEAPGSTPSLQPGQSRELWLNGRRVVEAVRRTADGELIRTQHPEPAPTLEVPEGSHCGVANAQGALLSCQPGTFCSSPAEGVQATCVRAPVAPRTDG